MPSLDEEKTIDEEYAAAVAAVVVNSRCRLRASLLLLRVVCCCCSDGVANLLSKLLNVLTKAVIGVNDDNGLEFNDTDE